MDPAEIGAEGEHDAVHQPGIGIGEPAAVDQEIDDLDGDEDAEVALDAGPKRDASSDAATPASDASSASDAAGDAASTPDAAGARGDAGASDGGAGGACGALTYESFGKAFVASYCISCHGASSRQVKLDTLPAIQAAKAQVKRAAVTSKAMPEGGKQPTDEERAKLGQWLDCGPL